MSTRVEAVIQNRQRRVEKERALIALLRDPELQDFIAELVGEKPGLTSAVSAKAATPANGAALPTKVTPAIRMIASELPHRVTNLEIRRKLEERKYDFHGRDPDDATRDAVYLLAKNGELFRLVEQGKGGKPNTYEKI